jgi:anti-anti-sigma factor
MSASSVSAPVVEDRSHLLVTTDLQAGLLTVTGELERTGAHHLLDMLDALALSDRRTWTVDVAGITFCDAEGLRVLARAESLARSRGRALVLLRPRPFLVRLLTLVGTHPLVGPSSADLVPAQPDRRCREFAAEHAENQGEGGPGQRDPAEDR